MFCNFCKQTFTRDFDLLKDHQKTPLKNKQQLLDSFMDFLRDPFLKPCKETFDYFEAYNPNPVGAMHLGNLIASFKGSLFARVLRVQPSYYVNDMGYNFAKYLISSLSIRPWEQAYGSLEVSKEQSVTYRLRFLESGLSEEEVLKRDYMVRLILNQLKQFKLEEPFLIYESSYRETALKLLSQSEKKSEGFFYKDLQVTTSQGAPLYFLGDLCYRMDLDSKYFKKAIFLGPDHRKYVKDLEKVFKGSEWTSVFSPIVRYKGTNCSKRHGNVITLKDLETLCTLDKDTFLVHLKLFLMKYESRSIINLEDLISELRSKTYDPLVSYDTFKEYNEEVFLSLFKALKEEDLKSGLIQIVSNLKPLMHWSVSNLKSNKLYKLLEYVQYLKKYSTFELNQVVDFLMGYFLKVLNL